MGTCNETGDLTGDTPTFLESVGDGFAFRERAMIAAALWPQGSAACTMRPDLIRDRIDQF
jgi:hypothetical protein